MNDISDGLKKALRGELDRIPLIDTHEHILPPARVAGQRRTLFILVAECYVNGDLVSAGMPPGWWRGGEREPERTWAELRRFLPAVRHTTYWRALRIALQDLFECPQGELTDTNWAEVSARVEAAARRGVDWYREVLKNRSNIELAFYDSEDTEIEWRLFQRCAGFSAERLPAGPDPEFFARVTRVDPFLFGYTPAAIAELEERYDLDIRSFDAFLRLLDRAFERMVAADVVATKLAMAYFRTLAVGRPTRDEAERAFGRDEERVAPEAAKAFQDYMLRACIERCMERHLPMQIHTGTHAGKGNVLAHSHPLHLTPLLTEYPRMRFDLFHGSFPFLGEMAALAKTFPNVTLNMCWLPLVSPAVARRALSEWLELVPASKLSWGGDCLHVEETYGHVALMKEVVSAVLAEKVHRGWWSEREALHVARMILRENAITIFRER